jgi:hypothetical protein
MNTTEHSALGLRTPADAGGDDPLKQLARLLGRAAARRVIARTDRSEPSVQPQSQEELNDRSPSSRTDPADDHRRCR